MRKLAVALLLFISSVGLFGQWRFIVKWEPYNLREGGGGKIEYMTIAPSVG